MIETKEIKMPSKKMLAVLYLQNGKLFSIISLVGCLLFIVIGIFVNIRFLLLALIWVFLFIPLIIAFLYFFYGLKVPTAFNSIPHKLIFDNDDIIIRILNRSEDNEASENFEKVNNQPDTGSNFSDESSANEKNYKDYYLKKSCFGKVINGPDYLLLCSHKEGWIWMPVDAFYSPQDISKILVH